MDILNIKKNFNPNFKENQNKYIMTAAACILAVAVLVFVWFFDWDSINSYTAYNTTSTTYVPGKVVSIESEELEKYESDEKLMLGEQVLLVEILSGDRKGETVEINNYLTKVHNINVSEGSRIIVCVDDPEDADPYYTVFSYDRTPALCALIACFALIVIIVGGFKGIRALLGVAYTLLFVIMFMAQAIYHGFSPVGVTLITVVISSGVSLLLLNGFSIRTLTGVLSTLAGVGATALIFVIFSSLLHLSGYNEDSSEMLLMVGNTTGLNIRYLLLAGVLISALGAVMDVSVGLVASLDELLAVDPSLSRKKLFASGLNIGRDMIGTMSNTLIMAFVGSDLDTILCLFAYGYSPTQLFSSDFLAIEMSQGLCATMGVVVTIPVTTAISALLLKAKGSCSGLEKAVSRTAAGGR